MHLGQHFQYKAMASSACCRTGAQSCLNLGKLGCSAGRKTQLTTERFPFHDHSSMESSVHHEPSRNQEMIAMFNVYFQLHSRLKTGRVRGEFQMHIYFACMFIQTCTHDLQTENVLTLSIPLTHTSPGSLSSLPTLELPQPKKRELWLRIYFQLSFDFWICLDAFCLKKMQPSDTSGGGSKAWIICRIAASCSTASNLGQLKSLGSWSWTGLRWRQVVTKKRRKKNDTKH